MNKPISQTGHTRSGMEVTKVLFIHFSIKDNCEFEKKPPVRFFQSLLHFPGITIAKLGWHLSNMNKIFNSYAVFWQWWKIRKIMEWRKKTHPWANQRWPQQLLQIPLHNWLLMVNQYTVCHLSNNSHFPEFPLTSMRGVLYASAPPGDGCRGGCQGCDRASLWSVGLISMKQDSRYTCAAHVVG